MAASALPSLEFPVTVIRSVDETTSSRDATRQAIARAYLSSQSDQLIESSFVMCPRTARSKKGDMKSTSNNSSSMSVESGDEVAAQGDAGEQLSTTEDTTPNINGGQNMKSESDYDADAAAEAGAHAARYANWPLKDVKEPTENDILYGRGGGTNHHPGNKRYRKWVEERKVEYVNSKRLDKPVVALEIVRKWREQSPPGRFLKLDEKTGTWSDVGDKKAREKTSQALREKAPEIRRELENEAIGGGSGGEVSPFTCLVHAYFDLI